MTEHTPRNLVLAVQLFHRGFAYVLFEGPESPFDWGTKEIKQRDKNTGTLVEAKRLIDRYRPEVLVIGEMDGKATPRTSRIRKLYRMLVHLAAAEYVDVHRCSRSEVRACFAAVGARTKQEIAKAIARQIPAFAHRLPRPRREWMGADSRQSLFDAVALALTYYGRGIPSPYADEVAS